MWKTLSDPILSITYPVECRVCGREVGSISDGAVCSRCWTDTKFFSGNETLCSKCGAFLFEGKQTRPTLCRKCDDHDFDRAFSLGQYAMGLSATVLHLKRNPILPGRLRTMLADLAVSAAPLDPALVIPVPLSKRRLKERGFNQAEILARFIADQLQTPLDVVSLIRSVHTPMHRVGMDRKARAATVKNAFEVVRPQLIAGKSILLIDDILTSGETASSCASALKKNGACSVTLLTIARAA